MRAYSDALGTNSVTVILNNKIVYDAIASGNIIIRKYEPGNWENKINA